MRVPLVDSEAVHREHPRTYSIPRREVRDGLRQGDWVKLVFLVEPAEEGASSERMWVRVERVNGGSYWGVLTNEPLTLTSVRRGDLIEFEPRHVAARLAEPDDPLFVDPGAVAVVSRRVWDEDWWPQRVERRDVPDPQFSGWYVLSGDEDASYRSDANNFIPVVQATLFARFPCLDSALEGPIGTWMIWNKSACEYERSNGRG